VKKAMTLFRNNYSLCLFPEGTRSKDGRLLKPNLSIIRLCYKENIAVVPAAIEGTKNVMARGSVIYNFFQKVVLKYTPPVLPENFPDEDSFAKACWQRVVDTHNEITDLSLSKK
jgi:1-acyl-sn-glycerol-3-phosphate acyltransferase